MGQVVIPDLFRITALGEKKEVDFHTRPGCGKHTGRQTDNGPQITFIHQLALGFQECALIGTEQQSFIQNDPAASFRCELGENVLQKKHLGGTDLKGKILLGVLALLAAFPWGR